MLWAFYTLGVMALGLRYASSPVRLGALALFGVTVVKAFVFDLAGLETVYRIVSLLILGAVLLDASFLYAHHRVRA